MTWIITTILVGNDGVNHLVLTTSSSVQVTMAWMSHDRSSIVLTARSGSALVLVLIRNSYLTSRYFTLYRTCSCGPCSGGNMRRETCNGSLGTAILM